MKPCRLTLWPYRGSRFASRRGLESRVRGHGLIGRGQDCFALRREGGGPDAGRLRAAPRGKPPAGPALRARHRRAAASRSDLLLPHQQTHVLSAFVGEGIEAFLLTQSSAEIVQPLIALLAHPAFELAQHHRQEWDPLEEKGGGRLDHLRSRQDAASGVEPGMYARAKSHLGL